MRFIRVNRYLRVKPGRYIVIGRLYVPLVDPDEGRTYRISKETRARRVAMCQETDVWPRRVSQMSKIWAMILDARKK